MMKDDMQTIDDRSRRLIQDSLPTLEAHRGAIVSAMSAHLMEAGSSRGSEWAARAATSLVTMLIEQARRLASDLGPVDLRSTRLEHLRSDITPTHYRAFADALPSVLAEVAGYVLPRSAGSIWASAFETIVDRMRREERAPIPVDRGISRMINLASVG